MAVLDSPTRAVDAARRPPPFGVGGEKVVETHGLTKRYGAAITAVDGLDLNVYRGEVYGFLGPNGAGKTATIAGSLTYGFWAAFGFALATVFRQSAMTIGLGLAYALVVELLKGIPATAAPFADATHAVLLLLLYVAVFVAISAWLSRSRDITS